MAAFEEPHSSRAETFSSCASQCVSATFLILDLAWQHTIRVKIGDLWPKSGLFKDHFGTHSRSYCWIAKKITKSKNIEIANGHNLTYIIARILHYILKVRENLRASLESDRAMVRDVYMIWGCYQELKRMIFRKSSKQPLPRSDVDEGNADFSHIPIFCTFLSPTYDNNFGGQICDHFGGKICGKLWSKTSWKSFVENVCWKILVYMPYLISLKPLLKKKHSIRWVFEALFCHCRCLHLRFVFVITRCYVNVIFGYFP